jgi:predicted dehydrogenase
MNIQWGIIGCGNVTEKKSGPAFQKIENSQLIAVMRRNAELAKDYAERHNIPKWYSDPYDLAFDPDINAIYIATPPNAHLEYVKLAAEAKKPVYVEKPVGRSYLECEEINRVCRDAQIPLFTAYYRRAQPRFRKLKEIVEKGQIGDIRIVNVSFYSPPLPEDLNSESLPWRVNPAISGGGRFIDLASHTLDILDFILGPITQVNGFAVNQANLYDAADTVNGIFQFRNGIQANGTWCFTADLKYDKVFLIGDKGKINFSVFSPDEIEIESLNRREVIHFERLEHVEMPLIQTVVDELRGRSKCMSNGVNALRVWWVMEKFITDYYQGN